jgi:hypothetical protein
MRVWPVCASVLLWACGDHDHPPTPEAEKSFQPLVGAEDWTPRARERDPFVGEEPPPACDLPGVRLEEEQGWLELDTTECGFITVAGGARDDVEQGQELALAVSHFDLEASEPATAELRLRFEECDVWSESIAIPSSANLIEARFDSPCPITQGGQVLFHLRNHGENTYQLRSLEVLR